MNDKEFKEMMYKKPHEMDQCGNPVPATGNLRDQFAIAALNGCLSHSDKGNVTFNSVKDATDYYAKLAYAYADAMLAARGKQPWQISQ